VKSWIPENLNGVSIFPFIKKQKNDSYYDVKGLGIGVTCLIGGLFLFFKSIL